MQAAVVRCCAGCSTARGARLIGWVLGPAGRVAHVPAWVFGTRDNMLRMQAHVATLFMCCCGGWHGEAASGPGRAGQGRVGGCWVHVRQRLHLAQDCF